VYLRLKVYGEDTTRVTATAKRSKLTFVNVYVCVFVFLSLSLSLFLSLSLSLSLCVCYVCVCVFVCTAVPVRYHTQRAAQMEAALRPRRRSRGTSKNSGISHPVGEHRGRDARQHDYCECPSLNAKLSYLNINNENNENANKNTTFLPCVPPSTLRP
jgi:hypothetical protein